MKCYCVFCKTGGEASVAQKINIVDEAVKAIAPMRIIQEKRKGKWEEKEKALLPGYVFVYSEEEFEAYLVRKLTDLYKVLSYDDDVRELVGKDYEYAMWVWRHQGNINPSKVLTQGGNVKVIEGPLIDTCGVIKKLDKHKRRAWVEFEFDGISRIVVLSAEVVDSMDSLSEK